MNYDTQLHRAQKCHEAGALEEAASICEEVLKTDPNNADALYLLGSIYWGQRDPDTALDCFMRLLPIRPDYDTHFYLGLVYMAKGELAESAESFKEALLLKPDDFTAHELLAGVYLRAQDFDSAIDCYRKAADIDPKNKEIQFMLDSLTRSGRSDRAPKEHVKNLFDAYAPEYEEHVSGVLKSRVPHLVYKTVSDQLSATDKLTVLDLACGTGLVGAQFKSISKRLIGVDLSLQMIGLAKQKNIYDELVVADIVDALGCYSNIDLITCSDSLVYFGKLDEVFEKCHTCLAANGLFAFSIEKTSHYPYELLRLARFAHTKEYVDELTKSYKYSIMRCDEVVLRQQKCENIEGYIYVIKKLAG